jgi:hypothetical protein
MAGTKIGGMKAAIANKERHGADFYKRIALKAQDKWDKNGRKPRGFSVNSELASKAGKKGGTISKRVKRA